MPLDSSDYPYYGATVTATGTLSGNQETVFTGTFAVSGISFSGGPGYSGLQQSLFEALQSWAENYDWADPDHPNEGETYAFGSFTLDEYTQQVTDVTPS